MIPLIEDYLRSLMNERINWLKKHPEEIPKIFGVLGRRSTLKAFTDFVVKTEFRVLLGFPREPSKLPCYIITLTGEQEIPSGLGDSIDEDFDEEDIFHINVTTIQTTYRIEAWADNSDLVVYMYILAKWAMLVSKHDMQLNHIILPTVGGADLEPAPDYFPIFVYRRALLVSLTFENRFYETEEELAEISDINYKYNLYHADELEDPE